jgi:hypothetical protein
MKGCGNGAIKSLGAQGKKKIWQESFFSCL